MESCPPLRPQQKDLQLLSSIFSSRAHETRAPSSSPLHVGPGRTGQLYLKLYEVSGKPFNVGADVFLSGKLGGWRGKRVHLSVYGRFVHCKKKHEWPISQQTETYMSLKFMCQVFFFITSVR